jgi:aminocarboxymuconate-semialdehyde decarboxylase
MRQVKKAVAKKLPRIDVHNHVIPIEMMNAIRQHPARYKMRIIDGSRGKGRVVRNTGQAFPIFREYYDAEAKLAGMDRMGIDIAVVSPAPMVFFYWLSRDIGAAAARITNDGVARMVAANPTRLKGMATLPLQDADASIAELERTVKTHGFRAVEIGTSVGDQQISDVKFRRVFRRAQELKVFVFVHPYAYDPGPGLENYYLRNFIGNPVNTTIMAANWIFSGRLDELRSLKICLAHGGGCLPALIGRFAHGYNVRSEARARLKVSPEKRLRRFYYDTITHDPRALRSLIDRVGADRVAIGTDAPFDMGDARPLESIARVPGLTREERDRIFSRTAKALLKMK